jgi:hypothetical protein
MYFSVRSAKSEFTIRNSEFEIGETPVETPFMASEVREFVKRTAFRDWNLNFRNNKVPTMSGLYSILNCELIIANCQSSVPIVSKPSLRNLAPLAAWR